jgi:hypothetical protein
MKLGHTYQLKLIGEGIRRAERLVLYLPEAIDQIRTIWKEGDFIVCRTLNRTAIMFSSLLTWTIVVLAFRRLHLTGL